MSTAVLERRALKDPTDSCNPDPKLIALARAVKERFAQYKRFDVLLGRDDERTNLLEFYRILGELRIQPFWPQSIRAYQGEMRTKDKQEALMTPSQLRRDRNKRIKEFAAHCFALLSVSLFMSYVVLGNWWPMLIGAVWLIVSGAVRLIAYRSKQKKPQYDRALRPWRRHEFGHRHNSVPDFILDRMVAIGNAVPPAQFFIETFETVDTKLNRSDDRAFMICQVNGDIHYIDFWGDADLEEELYGSPISE